MITGNVGDPLVDALKAKPVDVTTRAAFDVFLPLLKVVK